MRKYEKPQILLEQFETEDVIMESGIFFGITDLNIQQKEDYNELSFND